MQTLQSKTLFLIVVLTAAFSTAQSNADMVTLVPTVFDPTGASINALAGPLFSSDLGVAPISGAGMVAASADLDGNLAEQINSTELDYSIGPAFFDSVYPSSFLRTSTLDHRASAESIYNFTVDTPAIYEAMGFFSVADDIGTMTPGNVELEIELLAFDPSDPGLPPEVVFYSYQVSKSTLDAGFLVGGMDGDTLSVLEGSITGLLTPGLLYRYRTLVTTNAIDIDGSGPLFPTDGGAIATGEHTLLISAATVPEPGSIAILLTAGLSLLIRRRR